MFMTDKKQAKGSYILVIKLKKKLSFERIDLYGAQV